MKTVALVLSLLAVSLTTVPAFAGSCGGGDGSGGDGEPKTLSDEEFEGLKEAMSSGDVSRGHSNGSDIQLTEAQKKQLDRAFEKQKDFVDGNTKKTKLAKKYAGELKSIEESGMRLTEVGGKGFGDYDYRTGEYGR